MGQVAFEMVRQIHQGQSRFAIRLDPPELGRVDVKMQVDAAGGVSARLVVERPETLDLFQRDQRTLERALAQAGLDSSRTSLEFSLRQNPFGSSAGDHQQQHQSGRAARFTLDEAGDLPAIPAITLYRGNISAGGVNIFA
jgi:flagellar hook-length control protein FliK